MIISPNSMFVRRYMTTGDSVASITKTIADFSDLMTDGMKRPVRKHFHEYLMGMIIPPEIRRKSISNIASLVSTSDQSTLNRALHSVDRNKLEGNYIAYLKSRIGTHEVQFIGDDTLIEHPGSKVMEKVGWFHDHASGNNVLAHQFVTTMLHDLETDEYYPFLVRLYVKQKDADKDFKTKLQIMGDLFTEAEENFNIIGKTLDSWYSGKKFLGDHYITEMKTNRKVSLSDMGKKTRGNADLFYSINEILETTFILHERDTDILADFPLYTDIKAFLTDGDPVNLVILYNPENGRKKFLASDYLEGEDIVKAWNERWPIETFHNDAKDMGLGEYQVRDSEASLIHANTAVAAYALLHVMMRESITIFRKVLKTIGECSRAIKEILFFRKNYRSRLFSG